MSVHIENFRAALQEFERKTVVEQESMCATVQQINEQVMNLCRRPTLLCGIRDNTRKYKCEK